MTLVEVDLQGKADQSTKDQNLKNGFEKYMRDENKKLAGYKESVTVFANCSKKYVSEINVKKLKSLIGKRHISDLFKFLFTLLYDRKETDYDPSVFGKIALGDDADDFQIKLASFNTTKFHAKPEVAEAFKRVKDQEFPESVSNQDLNNLLNWMDYIYEMYLAELEFKQQQTNLKTNQSEFGDRLLKITLSEEDNVRKRQAVQIYRSSVEQIEIDKKLIEQKRGLVNSAGSGHLSLDKNDFLNHLEKFKKELYEMPNHL